MIGFDEVDKRKPTGLQTESETSSDRFKFFCMLSGAVASGLRKPYCLDWFDDLYGRAAASQAASAGQS